MSWALSTGIPPKALMGVPIIGLLIDLAATMNLTSLFMTELMSLIKQLLKVLSKLKEPIISLTIASVN